MKKNSFGNVDSVASNIYSGTADFGRSYASVVTIVICIVAVVAIFVGIYLISRQPVYTAKVDFLITKVTKEESTELQTVNGSETLVKKTVYNLEGTVKMCNQAIITLPGYTKYVAAGQTITAWMKPNCASTEAHSSSDDTRIVGWVVIAIAILVIGFNLLRLFFVKKYKGLAAIQGAAGAKRLFNVL
jgi:hypothetical protein